jgi:hypothetical protein
MPNEARNLSDQNHQPKPAKLAAAWAIFSAVSG